MNLQIAIDLFKRGATIDEIYIAHLKVYGKSPSYPTIRRKLLEAGYHRTREDYWKMELHRKLEASHKVVNDYLRERKENNVHTITNNKRSHS